MSNIVNSANSSYLKSVLHNGVGRYICQLQRITIRFSKSHGGHRGLREFIEKDLLDFVRLNPGVVVYMKPRRIGPPSITAEYLNGHTQYHSFPKKARDEIVKWVEFARTQSGYPISRFVQNYHTDNPSIQGAWTPFTNKDTSLNVTAFPKEELSKAKTFFPSATEQLLEIAEALKDVNLECQPEKPEAARLEHTR